MVLSTAVKKESSEDIPIPATTIVSRAGELTSLLNMQGQKLIGSIRVSTLELIAALISVHAQAVDQALADAESLIAALVC